MYEELRNICSLLPPSLGFICKPILNAVNKSLQYNEDSALIGIMIKISAAKLLNIPLGFKLGASLAYMDREVHDSIMIALKMLEPFKSLLLSRYQRYTGQTNDDIESNLTPEDMKVKECVEKLMGDKAVRFPLAVEYINFICQSSMF